LRGLSRASLVELRAACDKIRHQPRKKVQHSESGAALAIATPTRRIVSPAIFMRAR